MNNEYIKIVDLIDKKIIKDKNGYFYYVNIKNENISSIDTGYKSLEEALLDLSNVDEEKLYYEFKSTEVKPKRRVKK